MLFFTTHKAKTHPSLQSVGEIRLHSLQDEGGHWYKTIPEGRAL